MSLVLPRWRARSEAGALTLGLQPEFDAKASFDPLVAVPHCDLVEPLDQLDVAVEWCWRWGPEPCVPRREDTRRIRASEARVLTELVDGPLLRTELSERVAAPS